MLLIENQDIVRAWKNIAGQNESIDIGANWNEFAIDLNVELNIESGTINISSEKRYNNVTTNVIPMRGRYSYSTTLKFTPESTENVIPFTIEKVSGLRMLWKSFTRDHLISLDHGYQLFIKSKDVRKENFKAWTSFAKKYTASKMSRDPKGMIEIKAHSLAQDESDVQDLINEFEALIKLEI
ncbi:hypothetical protein GYB22_04855 [bacterium]|nr:hypothetical protein [bacterium]